MSEDQSLKAVIDLIKRGSICFLILHFYFYCNEAFEQWGLTAEITQRILINIAGTGLFRNIHASKAITILLLLLSIIGDNGKKDQKQKPKVILILLFGGLIIYFASTSILYSSLSVSAKAALYIIITTVGFASVLAGGARLSRLISIRLRKDIFNTINESFPQEQRLLTNEFSFNIPGKYTHDGKTKDMWINVINPFRATFICGSPGAGKSYFLIRHIINQHIEKGFSMFCYDFKFDDLTKIVYNAYLKNKHAYKKVPRFCVINFDDLSRSHRCNPLDPAMMNDITDAAESARTILLGLNREWVEKSGDFFVESPINFVTGIIWFLRKYRNGIYCTLPHCIELMQLDYNDLFPILCTEPEIEVYINPFVTAYMNRAMEQLEGQIASAKIGMARLSSPQLYWVMSGDDFTLDINNPNDPKILCCGNNPMKIQIYGAVLSLYVNRLLKLVNRKGQMKCSILFDEYPTIYASLSTTISTGRSNLVACTIAVQSIEQLRMDYSKEQADVIVNICGNMFFGQSSGDSAKIASEKIGKNVQIRESISINRNDTSISQNTQLDYAVPASRISNLTSGEFVGTIADNPDQPITHKAIHCFIQNDHEAIKKEELGYKSLDKFQEVTPMKVQNNYIKIRNHIAELRENEIDRIKNDPDLAHLLFVRPGDKK